ncbi:antitoxin MazE-like protein [Cupriavidus plantarum]|uniref:antitoxin MazE-like protein n=1 Tax=Cupriavidus plantarum TaxID=942865 RepID=UPI00339D6A04
MARDVALRVREHRAAKIAKGLKMHQIWLPDTTAPGFADMCQRAVEGLKNAPEQQEAQEDIYALFNMGDDE